MTKAGMLATLSIALHIMLISSAKSTDLGRGCCDDDEERIAELEASLARKEKRKVSLAVSGFVNEALYFWDDCVESNVYVGTSTREQTRVRFVGDAEINSDWSAGYTLELGSFGGDSRNFSQDDAAGSRANSIATRKSSWFLKSKTFGKLTVGRDASAMFHLLDDGNGTNAATFADPETNMLALGAFRVRDSNGSFIGATSAGGFLRWIDLLNGAANDVAGQDGLRELVRYDSPELAGCAVASTWGGDDIWAIALSYKGTIGDFDLTGRAGYSRDTDEGVRCSPKPASLGEDCTWWGVAGTIQHSPTGLFVYGVYSGQEDGSRKAAGSAADASDRLWLIEGGLEKRWSDLGKTTIYGQYSQANGGSVIGVALPDSSGAFIQNSEVAFLGTGIVQRIDAAAMDLYLTYTHAGGDFNDSVGNSIELEGFDVVVTGARLKF
ncbi:porin [Hyphomicrobium sp.]|uniref:porin n=1 Tax=Hyphomicrobium sp. TaxID=82 RepID=UPI0025BFA5FA|nr:porin [Hyphomicrobium sp.]MCC7251927.1 porin [Hyphomicrobium sp.]